MAKRGPLIERVKRFYSPVLGDGECWLWTGCLSKAGYGRIGAGGVKGGTVYAHRVMWEIHRGPIPKRLFVCHHCDTPACVNPAHLFLGTHRDNMVDMYKKDRRPWRPKEKCPQGHALTGYNLMVIAKEKGRRQEYRMCRACCVSRTRNRRAKKKLEKKS